MLIGLHVLVVMVAVAVTVSAGPARPPGPPESTFGYSLEDVYNRLDTGKVVAMSSFTEPSTGPGISTGYSIDDLFGLVGERAPVARTGQAKCWDVSGSEITCTGTGQDADLQKGATWPFPRFENHGDGTATDKLTGLVWLKNANCTAFYSGDSTGANRRNWDEALTAANSLSTGYCGLSDGSSAGDWRLPNVRELHSLVDFGRVSPALPVGHPFTDIQTVNWGYWTSSTCVFETDPGEYAWTTQIAGIGRNVCEKKTQSVASGYVLAVRDGE
jgi:hypothetical protein